jgi:hypothetical protein
MTVKEKKQKWEWNNLKILKLKNGKYIELFLSFIAKFIMLLFYQHYILSKFSVINWGKSNLYIL